MVARCYEISSTLALKGVLSSLSVTEVIIEPIVEMALARNFLASIVSPLTVVSNSVIIGMKMLKYYWKSC